MRHHGSRLPLVVLLLTVLPITWTVTADQSDAARAARGSNPPLTSDGRPDIQGYWTNDTYTPLERPAEFADKEFFTPEEAVAFVKRQVDRLLAQPQDNIHYDDAIWQMETYGKRENLRTSLIVEPRNGRLPPLTSDAERRLPHQRATQRAMSSDRAQSRSLAERCISWGNVGPPMLPPTYYANLHILQTRDQIVIRHELMDAIRIVYLDGRPHPGSNVRWLAGHSVGRWEGGTLIVDTTNFTDRTNFRGSPQNTRQDIFGSERLHVVERLTPVDPDTIRYEFTVDDPGTWTTPWSGESTIRRMDGPLYEYACHEGNYGLANILRGARATEASEAMSRPRGGAQSQ
jgi:hypothetical protein